MNSWKHKTLHAAVLMTLAATGVQSAHAAAPLVNASVQLNGLKFQLIDLNPDDGIAPSFTLTSPAGVNFSELVGSTSTDTAPVFNWATGSASPLPSATSVSPQDLSTLASTPSSLALTSKVQQQDLRTGTYSDTQVWGSGPELTQRTDTQTVTTAGSSADFTYYKPGSYDYVPELGDWGRTFGGTLSANTALIITGQSILNVRIDRASLSDGAAAAAVGLQDGEEVVSSAMALATLDMRITDGDTGSTVISYNSLPGGQFNSTFGSSARLDVNTDTPDVVVNSNGETLTDPQVDQSLTQNFSLVAFNSDSSDRGIGFVLTAQAAAVWQVAKLSSTTVTTPNPDWVPPTPTPTIPEPSTYALMGLGLVGIAAAARRRQRLG